MAGISFDNLMQEQQEPDNKESIAQEQKPKKPKKQKKPLTKKGKIIRAVLIAVVLGLLGYSGYLNNIKNKEMQTVYMQAQAQFDSGNYTEAYKSFSSIPEFKDASEKAQQCAYTIHMGVYNEALKLKEEGLYDEAILKFGEITEFEDAQKQIVDCYETKREIYIDKMGVLIYKINRYKELASSMSDIVYRDWTKAIQSNRDITVSLQETYKTWDKDVRQLNIGNKGLTAQVEELGELAEAEQIKPTKAIYELFIQYFELYNEIHKQAVEPSGDIKNYKERIRQHSKEFDSILEKIYVTEPAIKTIIAREVKATEISDKEQEISIIPMN